MFSVLLFLVGTICSIFQFGHSRVNRLLARDYDHDENENKR